MLEESTLECKKKRRWWLIAINSVLLLALLAVLAMAAHVIYLNVAYDEGFFVSGASMYPTLNGDALKNTDDGLVPMSWNDEYEGDGDVVDFGYCNYYHSEEEVNRYDIVIAYFQADMKVTNDGYYPVDGALMKIKRVIGLPNETIDFFTEESQLEEIGLTLDEKALFNTGWGLTVVNLGLENQQILQNLYSIDDFPVSTSGLTYNLSSALHGHYELGDHEYFLLGDNRVNSVDSRSEGNVPFYCLQAKASVITSRRILKEENGIYSPQFSYKYIKFPWQYTYL